MSYTSLRRIDSEVILWPVASLVYWRLSFHQAPSLCCCISASPISVNGWWLATTRPPPSTLHLFFYSSGRLSPRPPPPPPLFVDHLLMDVLMGQTRPGGIQRDILGFHALVSALWLDERASPKCWVIFQMLSLRRGLHIHSHLCRSPEDTAVTAVSPLSRWVTLPTSKYKQGLGQFPFKLRSIVPQLFPMTLLANMFRTRRPGLFTVSLHIYMSPIETKIVEWAACWRVSRHANSSCLS